MVGMKQEGGGARCKTCWGNDENMGELKLKQKKNGKE